MKSFRRREDTQNSAGLFLIIALFFLAVSIYQNAEGYASMTGYKTALVISIGIGLLMFLLIVEMRKRRLAGESTQRLVLGYCLLGFIFFAGNFNALYSTYNKNELLKRELQKHKEELTAITTKAISSLSESDKTSNSLKSKVEQLQSQLLLQIKDPANPGLGTRAQEIIQNIETLLGQKLTIFSGNPEQLAQSYSNNISQILSIKLSQSVKAKSERLIDKFQSQKDSIDQVILLAMKPQNISDRGQDAIFSTIDLHNNIGETTKAIVGKNFDFQRAEFENQDLGKIDHSFKSALRSDNLIAGFFCALFAFLFDFGVPIILHLFTKGKSRIGENVEPEGITTL